MDPHRALKRGIDSQYPTWRQEVLEGPKIVVVEGVPVLCASRLTFGGQAGHITHPSWWEEGEPGAAIKSGDDVLEAQGPSVIQGYLHFHRSLAPDGGISTDARVFFDTHRGEYSCFIPVEFAREGSESYPWRVRRRRS